MVQRTALVTGGANGIGSAVVRRLRASALHVLVADVDPSADIVIDIASSVQIGGYLDIMHRIDVLINCAGVVGPNTPLWEVEEAAWRRTLDVNLTGAFLMCRAVIPGMRERGWG
ncbi:MAG TPA: SDR family NAD(P)-dependent oxidoreductase, partial [Acidimicrobiales bacterium]|nr:SDR family NAD(P)-dependent oxidoreductase [Acidimicrobiales bacterium]